MAVHTFNLFCAVLCGFTFVTTCTGVHLRNVISDASSRHRFEPPIPSLQERKGSDLMPSTTNIQNKGTNSDKEASIALPLVEARESDAQGHDVEKEDLQHHVENDKPNGDVHSKTNELSLHDDSNTGAGTGTASVTGEREKKTSGTNENIADETENKGSGTNAETIGETEPEQVAQDVTPEGKPRPKPFKKVEMNGYVYYYYEDGAFDQSDVIDGTAVSGDQYYWDEASETTPEASSTEASKSDEQQTHPLVDGESVSHQQLGISGTDDHEDLAKEVANTSHNDMEGNIPDIRTTQSNSEGITQTTHENVNNKAHVESKSENILQQENPDTANGNKHQNIRSIDESKHLTNNEHSPGTTNNPGQNDFQHVDTSINNDPDDTQSNQATGQTFAQLGISRQGNGNSNSVDKNNDFSQAVDTSHVDNNIPTHRGTQFLGNKNNDFSNVVDTSHVDNNFPSHGDTQFLGNKNTLKEPDQNTESVNTGHGNIGVELDIPGIVEGVAMETAHDPPSTDRTPIVRETTTIKPVIPSPRPPGLPGDIPSIIPSQNSPSGADIEKAVKEQWEALRQQEEKEEDRPPEDVDPLNIFVSDITYQRFPRAMSLTDMKNKVIGRKLKKLYILEETDKKSFSHIRQLEVIYTLEDDTLYANLLFRFIFSRKCQEIERYRMGKLVGNTDMALFEKEAKDGKTERLVFFTERPDDYVFLMSCTDMKASPYACRESYYLSLDSRHNPPNRFPWAVAASELKAKMDMTFEDPRFIFNFVLTPCVRGA